MRQKILCRSEIFLTVRLSQPSTWQKKARMARLTRESEQEVEKKGTMET
jgi:hypothetical protein